MSMKEQIIFIHTKIIKLDQFLKLTAEAMSGGEAKQMIQEKMVQVNGEVCLMRGKKLTVGDCVIVNQTKYRIDYAVK